MIKRILCFFGLAVMFLTGTVVPQEKQLFTADQHKERGLACAACHREEQPKTAASEESCLSCHNSLEAVAERTKDFQINPHRNHLIESSDIACTACHQGHKADISACDQCHTGLKFERPQAETK